MLIYKQRTGRLLRGDKLIAVGYSGAGAGKNDPLAQHLPNVGPIPQGAYWITEWRDTKDHGPHVLPLAPVTGTELYGRSGFLIHGDSVSTPGTASHGCIIVPRDVREGITAAHDHLLLVLSGNEEVTT